MEKSSQQAIYEMSDDGSHEKGFVFCAYRVLFYALVFKGCENRGGGGGGHSLSVLSEQ